MKSIVLLDESMGAIRKLPDAEAGALIKALIDEDPEGLPPMADILFPIIKGQIDRMADIHDKRAAAGRAGGSKRKANNKQNEANEKQTEANDKQTLSPIPIPKPIPKPIDNNNRFVPPTVEEVKAYASEHGYKIDAERFVDFYASKGWMVGKTKMKDWKAAVRNWARGKTERQHFSTERDYDREAYNKQFFATGWGEEVI